jgi:hypothetical protein
VIVTCQPQAAELAIDALIEAGGFGFLSAMVLPLHVGRFIRTTALQRGDVIDDTARTRA